MAHVLPLHRHKRQNTDVNSAPTVAGIFDTAITAGATTTGTALAINTAVAKDTASVSVALAGSSIPVITPTPPIDGTSSSTSLLPSSSSTAGTSSSASSGGISLTTVVAACVGAFVGAIAIILVGVWLYRRSSPKPRAPSKARNAQGEQARSRSASENWGKLGEGIDEDHWAGKYQSKAPTIPPMEKLTMFEKSPSIRTAYTQKSEDLSHNLTLSHPFAQYHPNLAKELALHDDVEAVPRPFLGRVENGPPISWDGETVGHDSFLSLTSPAASTHAVNAAMSPSLDIARPTPALTSSAPHRWESAEVLDFEQEAEITDPSQIDNKNPFLPDPPSPPFERRKSSNNPFFGARHSTHSNHSRTPSLKSIKVPPPAMQDKGKQRAVTPPDLSPITPFTASLNPFSDNIPRFQPSHIVMDSTSSAASAQNDRAIQSLIAALGQGREMTPEAVQERLRIASLQPSFVSGTSMYTDDDDQTVSNFPLPPNTL